MGAWTSAHWGLMKTEVYELGRVLGVSESILKAKPTDGLWPDDRSDEDQIGATYPELERAMEMCEALGIESMAQYVEVRAKGWLSKTALTKALEIYLEWHEKGLHKVRPIPVCPINRD